MSCGKVGSQGMDMMSMFKARQPQQPQAPGQQPGMQSGGQQQLAGIKGLGQLQQDTFQLGGQ